jgi:SAM-dependent methyltransferase
MNIYTDGQYLENNPTWHAEHSAWKADHIAAILKKNGCKPASIAEIGCGTGGVIAELTARVPSASQFAGYEISPQAFAKCAERAEGRVTFHNQDIIAAPPAKKYDVVMAIDVFEHVDDYIGFIRALDKVGDLKVFHIPLELSVSSMLRPKALRWARQSVGHIHYFNRDTALATLVHAGLTIIDANFTALSIDRAETFQSKLMRWPRKLIFAQYPDLAARLFGGFHLLVLAK